MGPFWSPSGEGDDGGDSLLEVGLIYITRFHLSIEQTSFGGNCVCSLNSELDSIFELWSRDPVVLAYFPHSLLSVHFGLEVDSAEGEIKKRWTYNQ